MKNSTEQDKPLVSIGMITYNHEKYIGEAISSILSQQTNFNFEIVISDDLSSDRTLEICKGFIEKNPQKIKLIDKTRNLGVIPNFVMTLNLCDTKYIAICEGDDYWIDPLKLHKQVDFLENNPDFVMHCHNAKIIYEKDIINEHLFNEKKIKDILSFGDIVKEWQIPTASIVFRKETLPEFPLWFANMYHGDYGLGLLLSSKGKVKYSDEVMSVYRKQFGALSFNPKVNSEFASKKLIELFENINIETKFKYTEAINSRITELKLIKRKLALKRKYPILYPKFWFKNFLRKKVVIIVKNRTGKLFGFSIINLRKYRKI